MQLNILWSGVKPQSLENCIFKSTNIGIAVNSVIIGKHDNKVYKVEYTLKTNLNYETTFLEIKTQHTDTLSVFNFRSDGKGNWEMNGEPAHQFNGCIDVDISLTPFTNTLPINRLNQLINEPQQIKVLYFDVLEQAIKPVFQKYTRLSINEYKYENVPSGFKAIIKVDELGLVVDYPEIFVMADRRESSYK